MDHGSDVVTLAFRPDGRELTAATLNGQLALWDVTGGGARQVAAIEGRRDLLGGRLFSDRITAKNSASGKCFTSICYTADGTCLLAGGNSKYGRSVGGGLDDPNGMVFAVLHSLFVHHSPCYLALFLLFSLCLSFFDIFISLFQWAVCIYQLAQRVLLKRFCVSHNQSLDGILSKLNSRNMTEVGLPQDDEYRPEAGEKRHEDKQTSVIDFAIMHGNSTVAHELTRG